MKVRAPITLKLRCAYTRKSSEGGLEQEFNSQGEACEAYAASQCDERRVLMPAAMTMAT
jgi:ABC-type arginine/histidine transport system permease subunit